MTAADASASRLAAARAAARSLRSLGRAAKDAVLAAASREIQQAQSAILAANAADLSALPADATAAFRDRLELTPARLAGMAQVFAQVAAAADPVGEVVERRTLANGLEIRKVRAPLGVILMIFESRPNVVAEAFALALKSSNAIILRGGKEAMRTTAVLYHAIDRALASAGAPQAALWGVTDPDRALLKSLLSDGHNIDVVVPRGGDALIKFVDEHAAMPVIKNDRGLCHVYIAADADPAMAENIVKNAKTQRPGVCNAMETLLVDAGVAPTLLPRLYKAMPNVAWHGCAQTCAILAGQPNVQPATPASFDTEYLDLALSCRVVQSMDEAIAHIDRHGSRHSEAIITNDFASAARFQSDVDAAAVYWNASTRFTDGGELGLGGELGISTQKLHVRGPVGLREMTSVRWLMNGTGQIRS